MMTTARTIMMPTTDAHNGKLKDDVIIEDYKWFNLLKAFVKRMQKMQK